MYKDIRLTEAKGRSMLLWLRNLQIHKFEPRHFENIKPVVVNRSKHPLPNERSRGGQNLSMNDNDQSESCIEPKAKILKILEESEDRL